MAGRATEKDTLRGDVRRKEGFRGRGGGWAQLSQRTLWDFACLSHRGPAPRGGPGRG